MHARALGDVTVTALGCGDVSLPTAASRNVDSREVERALSTALELGVTLVDVAPDADSEALVGAAVRALGLRDRAVTAARIPLLVAPGARVDATGGGPGASGAVHLGAATAGELRLTEAPRAGLAHGLPVAYVQARVEAALRATKLDAIPLMLIPVRASWRGSTAWGELVGATQRLVREGKVLAWGGVVDDLEPRALSDEEAEERRSSAPVLGALALLDEPWLVALQLTYSACDRAGGPLVAAAFARAVPVGTGPDPVGGVIPAGGTNPVGGTNDVVPAKAGTQPKSRTAPSSSSLLVGLDTDSPPPARRIAILSRHPLAGGALAGTLGPGVRLALRDDRLDLDLATLETIALAVARAAPLVRTEPVAARSFEAARAITDRTPRRADLDAHTLAELALRFVMDRDTIALPRLHRVAHVVPSIAAASCRPLTPDITRALLRAIDPAFRSRAYPDVDDES